MAIDKSGEFWTGTEFADLSEYIAEYTREGYPAGIVQQCVCECGGTVFRVDSDAGQGCARRICSQCRRRAFIGDSTETWGVANPELCCCPCGADRFEVGIGFSLRPGGEIKWITVGVRCIECGTLASPVDWKIDYGPTKHLFENAAKLRQPPSSKAGLTGGTEARVSPPRFLEEDSAWIPIRARELSFYALDVEVQDWLVKCLPASYGPYRIVSADILFVGEWKRVRQPVCCPPSEFVSCMAGPSGTRVDYWIWSPALTPDLDVNRSYQVIREDFGQLCTLNGLPHLRHGLERGGCREASFIDIEATVQHFVTGAKVEHREYFDVFKALQKAIKKALRYGTRNDASAGTKLGMTEAAVRAHGMSIHFDREPGELINRERSRAR